MSADKLTVEGFKERIKVGKYETATAARRAVGKCSTWNDDDRLRAHAAINKQWPATAPKAKKAAAKPVKVATVAPAAAVSKKPAAKAAASAAPKKTPAKKHKASKNATARRQAAPAAVPGTTPRDIPPNPQWQFHGDIKVAAAVAGASVVYMKEVGALADLVGEKVDPQLGKALLKQVTLLGREALQVLTPENKAASAPSSAIPLKPTSVPNGHGAAYDDGTVSALS